MPSLFEVCSRLLKGESLARISMNARLSKETLMGTVMDVGGGHRPNYFEYFKKAPDMNLTALDGSMTGIDFEKDALPGNEGSVDTVILCNVLEHIYNYRFLVSEVRRVCAPEGHVIGYVPFWNGYHPDPHDYFRYTHESLEKIFTEAGFTRVRIEPLGSSPIIANCNTLILSTPRILRPVLYVWYRFFDLLFLKLRPKSAARNPFGYFFTLQP